MTDIIVSNNVLGIFVMLGLLGLISITLVKLYNLLNGCNFYDITISIILLAVGIICYVFVFAGSMITVSQAETNITLLEYNIYIWSSRIFILLIGIFWAIEFLIYTSKKSVEPFTRMAKRRQERFNNYPE